MLGAGRVSVDGSDGTRPLWFRESVDPLRLLATSEVSLSPDAGLSVRTSLTGIGRVGAHVAVVAVLYGGGPDPQWMWSSAPARFGVDEPDPGCVELVGTFVHDLDPELAATVRHVALRHLHSPGDAWADVRDWLRAAQSSRRGYRSAQPQVQRLG